MERVGPGLPPAGLRLFGLTGGIGSGKSTVGRHFATRGVPVIDADVLAREVVAPGSEGLRELAAAFGPEVLTAAGELDRKRMASIAFADPQARTALNSITHPRVAMLLRDRARALEERGERLACYEVPLLFESRLEDVLRPVVLVAASMATQVARTLARDGGTEAEVRARIDAQLSLDEKRRRADHVIENDGPLESTLARADEVLAAIRALPRP